MIPFNDAVRAQHATCEPILFQVITTLFSGGGGESYNFEDRIIAFDITASMDDSVSHLSVTLDRGLGAESLSPIQQDSIIRDSLGRPFLAPGSLVDLRVEVAGDGLTDSNRIFLGRIDSIDAAGPNQVTIHCRDYGAWLLNSLIPQANQQGGMDAKAVMDALIDTYSPLDAPDTLAEPVPSSFFIEPYAQQEMSVLEAMRVIAQQIGWDVRWFMFGLAGGAMVQFYDPQRFRLFVDYEFDEDMYTKVTQLDVNDSDVRNYWDVYWLDADGVVQGPAVAQDADSIAKYGLRYARIYVNRAENIRSTEAAQRFADAALADSKDPLVAVSIEGMVFPGIELNDWVRFLSTDQWSSAEQTGGDVPVTGNIALAVSSYHHSYANGHLTTTIGGRAAPIAAYRDYRLSIPPKTIITTVADPTYYAPEGTVVLQVESLAFP